MTDNITASSTSMYSKLKDTPIRVVRMDTRDEFDSMIKQVIEDVGLAVEQTDPPLIKGDTILMKGVGDMPTGLIAKVIATKINTVIVEILRAERREERYTVVEPEKAKAAKDIKIERTEEKLTLIPVDPNIEPTDISRKVKIKRNGKYVTAPEINLSNITDTSKSGLGVIMEYEGDKNPMKRGDITQLDFIYKQKKISRSFKVARIDENDDRIMGLSLIIRPRVTPDCIIYGDLEVKRAFHVKKNIHTKDFKEVIGKINMIYSLVGNEIVLSSDYPLQMGNVMRLIVRKSNQTFALVAKVYQVAEGKIFLSRVKK